MSFNDPNPKTPTEPRNDPNSDTTIDSDSSDLDEETPIKPEEKSIPPFSPLQKFSTPDKSNAQAMEEALVATIPIAAILSFVSMGLATQYLQKEPVQFIYPLSVSEDLHRGLINRNFRDLNFGEELIRMCKLWSLMATLPDNKELHVRAIQLNKEEMYLSAHVDFPRNSLEHLKGLFVNQGLSYAIGEKIMESILPREGMKRA